MEGEGSGPIHLPNHQEILGRQHCPAKGEIFDERNELCSLL